MPSKPTKAKKQTTSPVDPKEELANELNKVYATVVGSFSDRLTEKGALEVAVDTVKSLQGDWEARLFEIHNDSPSE